MTDINKIESINSNFQPKSICRPKTAMKAIKIKIGSMISENLVFTTMISINRMR